MAFFLSTELTRGACVVRAAVAVAALVVTALPQAYAAGVSGQGTWETTLQGRDLDGNFVNGFEAYYDTDLDITWLADASYSKTSGYDSDGFMYWGQAENWVAGLNYNGITGWRLPTMVDTALSGCDLSYVGGTDCGYSVQTKVGKSVFSEVAVLWYETLGNKSYFGLSGANPQFGWGLSNTGPFENAREDGYWLGVEYAPYDNYAWHFNFHVGAQYSVNKVSNLLAWAVHSGDVGLAIDESTAVVAEPQAYLLAIAGLACALVKRRRHA
jgi:hypothetical protein